MEEIRDWIDKNRPVGKLNSGGVDMYVAILLDDLANGKSGYDGSQMPKVTNLSELEKDIYDHVFKRAMEKNKC